MSELAGVLTKLQKVHGQAVVSKGSLTNDVPRIPTGIFQLDLATGGGFPCGRVSEIYGNEGSGKTTILLKLIAHVQRVMKKQAVLVDIENTFDPEWAKYHGVDPDKLVIIRPDNAEQVVDAVEACLYAEDVGIVGIDSIGAMATTNEINSGAEKQIVGGAALIVSKMTKKAVVALSQEGKRKHMPALVAINQTRIKIGVMFGDPETTPGGNSWRFACSMRVRVYGKDEFVKDASDELPAHKKITGQIKKWKVPIIARNFEFEMSLLNWGKMKIGEVASWNTVAAYLKESGQLVKDSGGWLCMGVQFKTLAELETRFNAETELRLALQEEVVKYALKKLIAPQGANGADQGTIDQETGEIKG